MKKYFSRSLSIEFAGGLQFRNVKPSKMRTRREKEQENGSAIDLRSTAACRAEQVNVHRQVLYSEWREEKKKQNARKLQL